MDLCLEFVWHPGVRVSKQCWKQDIIDLEGIHEAVQVAEMERE